MFNSPHRLIIMRQIMNIIGRHVTMAHIKLTHHDTRYASCHPHLEAQWVLLASNVLFEIVKTNLGH